MKDLLTILQFLKKFAAKKAGKEAQRDAASGDDPFAIDKPALSFLDPITGLNGAETAADEIVSKLRQAGVDPKQINYGRIVGEIEKGVLKDGMPLDKVKDSVFEKERTRIGAETTDPAPPREEHGPKDPLPEENGPPGEGKPSVKDSINPSDSGTEGKPQSHDLGTGTDAGDNDPENASPETRKFMKDLLEPGDSVEEIMMKRPQDLTEGEVRQIMIARMDATTEDERERLFKAEKGFFDHFFGNEPAGTDAVGRTMEPKPIRPIPETPKPIATADGEPLRAGLRRIGHGIVRDARDDGMATVIKRLQGGSTCWARRKRRRTAPLPWSS